MVSGKGLNDLTKLIAVSTSVPDPGPHIVVLPDPDALVRGMNPDPSIIKQK
jgi:hypothetical protein